MIIINIYWAANQHIKMISERSRDIRHVHMYTFFVIPIEIRWTVYMRRYLIQYGVYMCRRFQSEWRCDMRTLAYVLFAAFYTCQHWVLYFLMCTIFMLFNQATAWIWRHSTAGRYEEKTSTGCWPLWWLCISKEHLISTPPSEQKHVDEGP